MELHFFYRQQIVTESLSLCYYVEIVVKKIWYYFSIVSKSYCRIYTVQRQKSRYTLQTNREYFVSQTHV